jgi:hypothetical protein
MISKERLEELIEQGATIWTNEYRGSHFKIKLTKHFVAKLGDSFDLYGYGCDYFGIPLNHLFETKEEAEWYKEFDCIERRIRLDLPKWEDIEKDKDFHYIRNFIINNNFSFFIEIYKFTNKISIHWSNGCNKTDQRFNKNWELTKENYTIACRKAKELFLGDSNEE